MSTKTKNIEQTVTIDAKPQEVFATLMDSHKHARFTGAPAKIDPKPGGAFSCYANYITGITLEVEPNKRIVQAWRSRNWAKGSRCSDFFRSLELAIRECKGHGLDRLTYAPKALVELHTY